MIVIIFNKICKSNEISVQKADMMNRTPVPENSLTDNQNNQAYHSCLCVCMLWLQLCPTLKFYGSCSLTGYSVHGNLQARILKWVALPSSRGSSQPRDQTCISCLLHWQGGFFTTFLAPPGKPKETITKCNIVSWMGCWNRKRTSGKN